MPRGLARGTYPHWPSWLDARAEERDLCYNHKTRAVPSGGLDFAPTNRSLLAVFLHPAEPLSIESAAGSLGSTSESGHGYECSTPSETNCSFDPAEEAPVGSHRPPFLQPPPHPPEVGFFQVATSAKPDSLRCSGEAVDFSLPGSVTDRLPLISDHVGLGRAPETLVGAPPAQVSFRVPDFSLLGIRDVNNFLATPPACPTTAPHVDSLSQ